MNQADLVARRHVSIVCNNCKQIFHPYGSNTLSTAPILDEVVCPNCGTKRILYYGEDTSVVKMILSNLGMNKEITEKLTELEKQVANLKEHIRTSLVDAKNVMTTAVITALNQEIQEHEQKWHNVKR